MRMMVPLSWWKSPYGTDRYLRAVPWICSDDGPLVEELPVPCGPGGCPAWVVEYSPIDIVHPNYFTQSLNSFCLIGF